MNGSTSSNTQGFAWTVSPQQVREKMLALAEAYQTPDLSVVTICYGFRDRERSYELVAQACGLDRQPTG